MILPVIIFISLIYAMLGTVALAIYRDTSRYESSLRGRMFWFFLWPLGVVALVITAILVGDDQP